MNAIAARRLGATLVELLVALTVASLVLGAALRVVLGVTRSSDRTRERARQQALFRASSGVLRRELAGLDPAHDLGAAAQDSLTVRTIRGTGRTCGVDAGAVVVALATYRAWRLPDPARDSVLVPAPTGDQWITMSLDGPTSRAPCGDGTPGLRLQVNGSLAARASVSAVPVRIVEWVRFRVYSNAEEWWLGQRSLRAGDVTQPIAGPFTARALGFRFHDGEGAPTSLVASMRSVALAMRTVDDGTLRGVAADSVVAWVPLGASR